MKDTLYSTFESPQFRILSRGEVNRVFQAALDCLQRTGVEISNQEARDLLETSGADVEGSRVRIPSHIVQDAIATNPRSFTIYGRDPKMRMQITPNHVYFGPGPTCTYIMDPFTGKRRKPGRKDPGITARVCDALEHIDFVMSLGLIDDVTPALASVYEFAEMITNTGKPILPWAFKLSHLEDIYRIALCFSGSEKEFKRRPLFAFFSTWQAPLIHTEDDLKNCLWAVERGIPVVYAGGGIAGLNAPVTGAGLLVLQLANTLAGLAILQLKKRGAPVCVGGVPTAMDLKSTRPTYGTPEMSLYSAAICEIFKYLNLPFMGTAGASDSKLTDMQAAIESTTQILLSSLSGANLVHDIGFLDCADIGSLEMLVMSDEIIAMTKRIMRGIEITDETLMLDLIDEVGPSGEFISSDETARRCRKEITVLDLMDRDPWDIWRDNDSMTMYNRITRRLHTILENHESLPVPDGIMPKINAILEAAEKREASEQAI
ncbi:MAG: trimethylamine methyltransferase family protein [Thermodesulfobacteriota bacterium]